ncbi:MFS transporter [Dactylosporangium sp. CA-139114]|uniref:MFS transporter n=1 Tax=Dactylosporangium sp. CA-139114 TaxID=3239931 RepID=UPI003D986BEC
MAATDAAAAHRSRHRAELTGGRRRAGRLRELLVSGVVDSFGLSLGWTLFTLVATERGGLPMAALFSSAMLLGVVLSAPITGWLARHLHGRTLLLLAGCTEAVLRIGLLAALLAGANPALVAVGVTVMHVAAFAGFAAMRAEVAAVDARPRAMTRYALSIAAVEAAGAGVAALLPMHRWSLAAVFAVYGLSLLPTMLTARRARTARLVTPPAPAAHATRVERRRAETEARGVRVPLPVLAAGGGLMLLSAGPTLLSVALATELHGQHAVAGAAAAFSAGCLLSSWAVDRVGRLRLPAAVVWPLWGVGMLVGWLLAPAHLAGLFLAQFLSGLSMTAFEGGMDARLAQAARPGTVTTVLAWSASTRALGSAIAVRTLPALIAAPAVGTVAGTAAAVLALVSLAALARSRTRERVAAANG